MTLLLLVVVVANLAYIGFGLLRHRRSRANAAKVIPWRRSGAGVLRDYPQSEADPDHLERARASTDRRAQK
jgi:hypothetical protein